MMHTTHTTLPSFGPGPLPQTPWSFGQTNNDWRERKTKSGEEGAAFVSSSTPFDKEVHKVTQKHTEALWWQRRSGNRCRCPHCVSIAAAARSLMGLAVAARSVAEMRCFFYPQPEARQKCQCRSVKKKSAGACYCCQLHKRHQLHIIWSHQFLLKVTENTKCLVWEVKKLICLIYMLANF